MEKENKYIENINMTNIIVLALVYNYLSNKTNTLTETEVQRFFDDINYELHKEHSKEVSGDLQVGDEMAYKWDSKNQIYKLEDIYSLHGLYFNYIVDIPEKVLKISLNEEILKNINVNREYLKTKHETVHVSKIEDIYSLRMVDAQKTAVKYLELAGCKNIKVGYASPDQLNGDKGYHVPVSYDQDVLRIDIDESVKALLKRKTEQQK